MQKLTNFFKYNNAFVLIVGFLFLAAGSSFASEKVRDAVIGQTIEEVKGMDNSALLATNLDSIKQEMSIADVSEDEKNYYVAYVFSTFDIKDNAWQNQVKNQILKVPKETLNGGKDLGLYVQSELSQLLDSQLSYLKNSQGKEREKGITKIVKTTTYTGLKGLVLNSETKELEGYEPVIKKEEKVEPAYVAAVVSTAPIVSSSSSSAESSSSSGTESSSSATAFSSSQSSSSISSSSSIDSQSSTSSASTTSSSSEAISSSTSSSSSSESLSSSSDSSSTTTEATSSPSSPTTETSSSSSTSSSYSEAVSASSSSQSSISTSSNSSSSEITSSSSESSLSSVSSSSINSSSETISSSSSSSPTGN